MNRKTQFLAMVGCHALADYPLQGDFLAKGKNQPDLAKEIDAALADALAALDGEGAHD